MWHYTTGIWSQTSVGDWALVFAGILLLLYIVGTWNYDYFRKQGIPSTSPKLPFIGDMMGMFMNKSFPEIVKQQYKRAQDHGVYGSFQFIYPVFTVVDPELIKLVTVKEFDNFMNHQTVQTEKSDPVFSKNLFNLKDQAWRDMRATLSPAFTTSKIKGMFPLISKCGEQMVHHLRQKYANSEEGALKEPLATDMKDLFTRLANDVIATAAFGVSCDSMKDPDNDFYRWGKVMTTFSQWRKFVFLGYILIPKLMQALRLRVLDGEATDFFFSLVNGTLKERRQKGIFRPDMLQLLMQAREGQLKAEKEDAAEAEDVGARNKNMTDDDICAQAGIFFLAGFETVSTALCLTAHLLAHHDDVQQRLYAEISQVMEEVEGNASYEFVQGMKYLDAVIYECLRLYPPAVATERVCQRDTQLPAGAKSRPVTVRKGQAVSIPIMGLHYDAEYWPDPEKFDPERFSDENKHNIRPFTYMPFGVGPRFCIGQRFALMEVKLALVHLVSNFELTPCPKTKHPLEFTASFNLMAKGGFWCGLTPRDPRWPIGRALFRASRQISRERAPGSTQSTAVGGGERTQNAHAAETGTMWHHTTGVLTQTSLGDWALVFAGILLLLYIVGTLNYDYFRKQGIPSTSPKVPFVGDMIGMFMNKSFPDIIKQQYKRAQDHGVYGSFQFIYPVFTVVDPELIKVVAVKEFDNFMNHQTVQAEKSDPVFSKNLFNLKDQAWRDMRATLSPAFTTSKIKGMFPLISKCGEQMVRHLRQKYADSKEGALKEPLPTDMKDLFTRLANDVIATAAFGVSCDSMKNPDNDFYRWGKVMTTFSKWRTFVFIGYMLIPKLMQAFRLRVLDGEATDFFFSLVNGTLKERRQKGIFRPDMLQLLMQAREGQLKAEKEDAEEAEDVGAKKTNMSDEDICAQAGIFFFAGFETVSTALCLTAHLLAYNDDVQNRLYAEISQVMEEVGGNASYESVQGMKYLDAVINECLRLYPPAVATERVCQRDTQLPAGAKSRPVTVRKGQAVSIPIMGLHYDAEYWPDPEKFDPDRFSDENKHNIRPFTYMPFGVGPRFCIGQRFALMEVKLALVHLVSNFELTPCPKTKHPLEFTASFNLMAKGGFWCGLTPRDL